MAEATDELKGEQEQAQTEQPAGAAAADTPEADKPAEGAETPADDQHGRG
jgi:hypothetical protein